MSLQKITCLLNKKQAGLLENLKNNLLLLVGEISFDDNFSSVRLFRFFIGNRKIIIKTVLDTRHFECGAYREVLFRFSSQKTLELTLLITTPNGVTNYFTFTVTSTGFSHWLVKVTLIGFASPVAPMYAAMRPW